MLTLRASVLALLLGLGGLAVPGVARASGGAVAEEALERLQISDDQRRQLGTEVVAFAVDEHGERELAVGLAILVTTRPRSSPARSRTGRGRWSSR